MYLSLFPRDVYAEMDRLQREMQQAFDIGSPSIRGFARGRPALNVGSTPSSVEIYAFAPGIDPAKTEVSVDRGVLTIDGERKPVPANGGEAAGDERTTLHLNERFVGAFRRVVSLPDDIDPSTVSADCRDGVLHVSIARRESAKPRRVTVN